MRTSRRPVSRSQRDRRSSRALVAAGAGALVVALAGCDLAAISKVSGEVVSPAYDPAYLFGGDASDDGSIVVFESEWAFDPADTNEMSDVIVSDRTAGTQTRVSSAIGGGAPNADVESESDGAAVSGDGRYVTWTSAASDIVPGDTNGVDDVFRHDRTTGTTVRISVATGGAQANGPSGVSSMSDDGRFVAFQSDASNLVANDTNGRTDVFVRDMKESGTTTRWSIGPGGVQGTGNSTVPQISGDGTTVAFASMSAFDAADTNGLRDVYRKVGNGSITRISQRAGGPQSDGASTDPAINQDGTVVAFRSIASTLVVGFDDNAQYDIYVWEAGGLELVSMTSTGGVGSGNTYHPTLDDSGNLVGFSSTSPELTSGAPLTQALVRNRADKRTDHVSASLTGEVGNGVDSMQAISGDGRSVVVRAMSDNLLPDDPNYSADLLVKSYPFPRIASVKPSTLMPGTTTTVTIDGTGFAGPLEVSLSAHPSAAITLSAPVVLGPKRIRVQVTVPAGATAHTLDVTVRNPGVFESSSGAQTTCYDCLQVG